MNFGSNENTGTGTNSLSRFTSGSGSGSSETIGSNDFMQSNSLVARVAFLLLVLFGFVVLLRIGIGILGYFYGPSSSPKLIDGMVDASQLMIIEQDPASVGSKTIPRSVNASDGIEFTWSCWIFINNLNDNGGRYRCVFYKGMILLAGLMNRLVLIFPIMPQVFILPQIRMI